MVMANILPVGHFHKDITGKHGAGRLGDLALAPDIDAPLGKVNRKGYFRMQGPQEFYIFFFRPCFYLQRIIIHRFRITGKRPIVNVWTRYKLEAYP
jgi:hypothetical protein